ncbi:threonine--tRNA ligase [Desulfurispira natronophila]|uniref:Threonine--tRNA ligase n=1 Tax=Desulfurispira natronophila TaxID=682562 RepID=A0A7W8DH48_9BACT|nr:threonine--tRNA ligase [Desulfurispira natronophila]MBB5022034.1 threonyl-tRNA synthetase [Desulfurispira natronophila]
MICITLPDETRKEFPQSSVTPFDIAESIGKRLAKDAVAARVDGELRDLGAPIDHNARVEIITPATDDGLDILRHSASHIMAQAVKELFGDEKVKVAIGPATSDGFYYDFDLEHRLTPEDLERIEKRMNEIARQAKGFTCETLSRHEAIDLFARMGEQYKVELLQDIEDETVSVYRQGSFIDLCRGPHVPSTDRAGAFKLLSIAGAYWRGDEKRPMLQRIYGTTFPTEKELKQYLNFLEEARKRDHRKLGKELDLFHFDSAVAVASPFFHPKGTVVYNQLLEFIREMYRHDDYGEIITPQVMDVELWKRSGHYDNYVENMYFTELDGQVNALKPMNCPAHVLTFGAGSRSYRELPVRYADFGRLHRYERSGVVQGLARVRTFSQDDAHIFCRPDQIEGEIKKLIDLILKIYKVFSFEDVAIGLSTRPEKSMGSDEIWQKAEASLVSALKSMDADYHLNEGDGAFYGPKIDFQVHDAIRRQWQLATIQLDFSMPERFGVTYVDEAGQRQSPVMIHRAVLGSLERFMGLYLEHTGGALPFWLAPVQCSIIPVNDEFADFCSHMRQTLKRLGYRAEVDMASESMGKKIRRSQTRKYPFTLVVGQKERENGLFAVRSYGKRDTFECSWQELLELFHQCNHEARQAMGYDIPPVHIIEL